MKRRLTEDDKAVIRSYEPHRGYLGVLAEQFGVSVSAINNVLHDPRYLKVGSEARRDNVRVVRVRACLQDP
jgi:hypothetical protein